MGAANVGHASRATEVDLASSGEDQSASGDISGGSEASTTSTGREFSLVTAQAMPRGLVEPESSGIGGGEYILYTDAATK